MGHWILCGRQSVVGLAAAAVTLLLCAGMPAMAQFIPKKNDKPSSGPKTAAGNKLDPMNIKILTAPIADTVIRQIEPKERTLNIEIRVTAFNNNIDPVNQPISSNRLKFERAVVVFPLPAASAGHRMSLVNRDDLKGELSFGSKLVDDKPTLLENYPAGTRLAKWEASDQETSGMSLKLTLPTTLYKVVLDEQLAFSIPWHETEVSYTDNGVAKKLTTPALPPEMRSSFDPQMGVDWVFYEARSGFSVPAQAKQTADTRKAAEMLIKQWTSGNDIKKLYPVHAAKFIAQQAIGHFQESGNGYASNSDGSFQGFTLQGALRTMRDKKGSEHDLACVLVALYHAAGLPARTVIGWDRVGGGGTGGIGGRNTEKLRSWVEFGVVDPINGAAIWIPVDIARQRKKSSAAPDLDKSWDYFGTIADLQEIIPIAFQYHPPTTVQAHGSPCLWGWLTTPTTQNAAQWIRFSSLATPVRGDRPPAGQPGYRK